MSASQWLDSFTRSDSGLVRENNEDAVGSFEPADPVVRAERGCLYLVADGMGGHAAGEVASGYAVQKILHDYYSLPWMGAQETLAESIRQANADIYADGSRSAERRDMGSTLVAAAVLDSHAVIANVGDSRAYLLRGGRLVQLTRDHSWVAERLADGTITPEQAIDHPNANVLTRNLGHRPNVEPDMLLEPLHQGDRLLLCTDGLWGALAEGQMAMLAGRGDAVQAAMGLVSSANAAGGPDNIGVAVVSIGGGHGWGAITRQLGPLTRRGLGGKRTGLFYGAAGAGIVLVLLTLALAAYAAVHASSRSGQFARPGNESPAPTAPPTGSATPPSPPATTPAASPAPGQPVNLVTCLGGLLEPNQQVVRYAVRSGDTLFGIAARCETQLPNLSSDFVGCAEAASGIPPGMGGKLTSGQVLYLPAAWPAADGVCDRPYTALTTPAPRPSPPARPSQAPQRTAPPQPQQQQTNGGGGAIFQPPSNPNPPPRPIITQPPAPPPAPATAAPAPAQGVVPVQGDGNGCPNGPACSPAEAGGSRRQNSGQSGSGPSTTPVSPASTPQQP